MAMQELGVSQADLGRRLGWHPPQVVRILDPRHNSSMNQIEMALAALGKRMTISIQDAA
ncbi:MAG: helix-turn-helix domain-containing protein [Magnetococcus sp. DMHC-1]